MNILLEKGDDFKFYPHKIRHFPEIEILKYSSKMFVKITYRA
jgi:hypothetical protein